ncbi:MAG TPA: hypothetical protein VGL47_42130 [Amycolatopsis sp.]|uniref:hypothetical protein n=1 Tax=Amycolatopsis sp. TaxID=37632 RepID=UPI002F4125C9
MREDNVRKIWSDAELDAALADLHSDVDEEDGLAFARASLLAAAGVSEAPPPERRRPWRWIAVAAAVITLVGGLVVVTSLKTSAPEPAQPAASLADLDRPLTPGEFRYAQRLSWRPEIIEGRPVQFQEKTELWIPADPAGVWHRRTMWTGAVRGLTPDEEKSLRYQPVKKPVDERGLGGVFPGDLKPTGQSKPHWNTPFANWLTPDAALVASLVPDRGTLAKRLNFDTIDIKADGRAHSATEALAMVRSVLELGLLRKDVRFALRDAFNEVTGAYTTQGQTPDGRPATILLAKDSGQTLYLDPATAQLLAWDTTLIWPSVTRSSEVALNTVQAPPPSSQPPPTTTMRTEIPRAPSPVGDPETVYSFAITRGDG